MKRSALFRRFLRRKIARLVWGDRGQVLAVAALGLIAMMGAGAISVDVGYMYVARNALQNAADAGSRAGAAILAGGGTQSAAAAEAASFVNQNTTGSSYLSGATTTVTFPDSESVTVSINHNLSLFFAQALGFSSTNISTSATAGLSGVSSVGPNNVVPLAIYCNNAGGCNGVLSVGQNWSLRRYCGNFFADGPDGNGCGNTIADGETFLVGITFDNSNSNAQFRSDVYNGYSGTVSMNQQARALPGNRNGWKSGMTNRLSEGRNEMTLAVIRELSPTSGHYNIQVVDFVQVRVSNFSTAGHTDTTTFEIIRAAVSTTDFAESGEGLGINSVVGVRLSN